MLHPMRYSILIFALAVTAVEAAETPSPRELQPTGTETVVRSPTSRVVPSAPMFRFEPKGDITTAELDQLKPYLSGKPLSAEDQKDLGPAMRHLRELK